MKKCKKILSDLSFFCSETKGRCCHHATKMAGIELLRFRLTVKVFVTIFI